MKAGNPIALKRLALAILLPLVAFVVQSLFWEAAIKPFAWFLFFPAVFFSSWIGGLAGGAIATLLSTALAWWFFIPPERSFALEYPFHLASVANFMVMGFLFGYTHERIKKANRKTAEALAAARAANEQLQGANEKITQLYEKTLERIRGDERTRVLPVVILTSSRKEQDIVNGYRLGCNSYVHKPVDFDKFTQMARQLGLYWLLLNEAPPR